MGRYVIAIAAVAVLVATVLFGAAEQRGGASSSRIESFGPSPRVLQLAGVAFQLVQQPTGVVSPAKTLNSAGGLRHPPDAKDVHFSMVFGRLTDRGLSLSNRPAWILTMTGVHVSAGHGRTAFIQAAPHESNIVIDAMTGKYLQGFGD